MDDNYGYPYDSENLHMMGLAPWKLAHHGFWRMGWDGMMVGMKIQSQEKGA